MFGRCYSTHMNPVGYQANLQLALILGFAMVFPLGLFEYVYRDPAIPRTEFPLVLYISLWALTSLGMYLVLSLIAMYRKGDLKKRPAVFAAQTLAFALLVCGSLLILLDQLPCISGGMGGC